MANKDRQASKYLNKGNSEIPNGEILRWQDRCSILDSSTSNYPRYLRGLEFNLSPKGFMASHGLTLTSLNLHKQVDQF